MSLSMMRLKWCACGYGCGCGAVEASHCRVRCVREIWGLPRGAVLHQNKKDRYHQNARSQVMFNCKPYPLVIQSIGIKTQCTLF